MGSIKKTPGLKFYTICQNNVPNWIGLKQDLALFQNIILTTGICAILDTLGQAELDGF
jgi:hypothetical protein